MRAFAQKKQNNGIFRVLPGLADPADNKHAFTGAPPLPPPALNYDLLRITGCAQVLRPRGGWGEENHTVRQIYCVRDTVQGLCRDAAWVRRVGGD